jgi:hypothetical protein
MNLSDKFKWVLVKAGEKDNLNFDYHALYLTEDEKAFLMIVEGCNGCIWTIIGFEDVFASGKADTVDKAKMQAWKKLGTFLLENSWVTT